MNIFQIVEQTKMINTNTDLGTAFSREQWISILNHFVTLRNGSLGSNRASINTRMEQFHKYLGLEMAPGSVTVDNWNLRAGMRYNMGIDTHDVTWQKIYNHLAPHAGEDNMPAEYDIESSTDVGIVTFGTSVRELHALEFDGSDQPGPWTRGTETTTYITNFYAAFKEQILQPDVREWMFAIPKTQAPKSIFDIWTRGIDAELEKPGGMTKDWFMQHSFNHYNSINSNYEDWSSRQ